MKVDSQKKSLFVEPNLRRGKGQRMSRNQVRGMRLQSQQIMFPCILPTNPEPKDAAAPVPRPMSVPPAEHAQLGLETYG